MGHWQLTPLPAFSDNYIWVMVSSEYDTVMVVDPGDPEVVLSFLTKVQKQLGAILVTHHHPDHVGGLKRLHACYPTCAIYGPKGGHIPEVNHPVSEGDTVSFQDLVFTVMETPGHTLDHVAYHNDQWLFCGDTLFSAGCGRLFEGTPQMLYDSLMRLSQLSEDLAVCCTHEYTLANIAFAKAHMPDNADLQAYAVSAQKQRALGKPTLPSSLLLEKSINPFLRCHFSPLKEKASTPVAVFSWLRQQKDNF